MVRFKNRYALCELIFPDQPSGAVNFGSKLYQEVNRCILENYGDYGVGALQFSLAVKYINIDTKIAIIRGERKHFDMVKSTLPMIRNIGPDKVVFKTLHVGGSVRACQKFLIKYHHKNMAQAYRNCKTDEQRASVLKVIMDACDSLENFGSKEKAVRPTALDSLKSQEDME
ncbi:ribonuclease P/MRP protein subunit POP5-like [Physella acuta]|uniref:ribonuclease P/MRP protein subunit POP5-like n=1 Tax=Physella acuta TaxID=109671 RepID=UPI0027DD0438|nr:ribonuclease P/MRP protein subunit POP5-like [Physella acuta]